MGDESGPSRDKPVKVIRNLLEVSAQGDGGRWPGWALQVPEGLPKQDWGVWDVPWDPGELLMLGAGWILELSPSCLCLADVLQPGTLCGCFPPSWQIPSFHTRSMCCAASSWIFFPPAW